MKFHVITLFPEMIEPAARIGLVGQAIDQGRLQLQTLNPREFTSDVHHTVDDRPFCGGDGMVMLAEPSEKALDKARSKIHGARKTRVVHLSPRGHRFDDKKARELAELDDLILISSRYGGLDQRFINAYVDEEISIGDYVLSGGELAALVIVDAVGRLVPGVLGNIESPERESFAYGAGLEHPQFTRPREWKGQGVPSAYLSGDHARIAQVQRALGLLVTLERRPDLTNIANRKLIEETRQLFSTFTSEELRACGFKDRDGLFKKLEELAARAGLK